MLRQPLVYDLPTTLTATEKKKARERAQTEINARLKAVSLASVEYKQKLAKSATKKNKGKPLTAEQVHEIEASVRTFRKQKRDAIKQEYAEVLKSLETYMLLAKQEQAVTDAKLAHAEKIEQEMLTSDENLFPLDPIHMIGRAFVAGTNKLDSLIKSKQKRAIAANNKKNTR